jgi:hypothetical protein
MGLRHAVIGGLATAALVGAMPNQGMREIRELLIQHEAHVEPFAQFADDMVRQISDQDRIAGQDPVETVLSMMAEPERWEYYPCVAVPASLRGRLGLPPKEERASRRLVHQHTWLAAQVAVARARAAAGRRLSRQQRDVTILMRRCDALDALIGQEVMVVPAPGQRAEWLPVLRPDGYPPEQQIAIKRLWAGLLQAVRLRQTEQETVMTRRLLLALENLRITSDHMRPELAAMP